MAAGNDLYGRLQHAEDAPAAMARLKEASYCLLQPFKPKERAPYIEIEFWDVVPIRDAVMCSTCMIVYDL